jgi:3-dehydroquinate dehydratase-2
LATTEAAVPSILILNGPNLNLLGTREPGVYGTTTLADVEAKCRQAAQAAGFTLEFTQSNHEGVLIDAIHAAALAHKEGALAGVVFNPGAYTHTSVALHDAIKGVDVPVIEVHISNVHAREPFRHRSHVSPAAAGIIIGFGVDGYLLGIEALVRRARAGT